MSDTDKYIEDVEEKYNLIMNLMDDEEREFEIKTRIRERNKIMVAYVELDAEVKRLREENDMLAEAVKGDNEILKKHIETLAEVKRLREAISDIARCMDAADPVYLQGFIKDLYEVIE